MLEEERGALAVSERVIDTVIKALDETRSTLVLFN